MQSQASTPLKWTKKSQTQHFTSQHQPPPPNRSGGSCAVCIFQPIQLDARPAKQPQLWWCETVKHQPIPNNMQPSNWESSISPGFGVFTPQSNIWVATHLVFSESWDLKVEPWNWGFYRRIPGTRIMKHLFWIGNPYNKPGICHGYWLFWCGRSTRKPAKKSFFKNHKFHWHPSLFSSSSPRPWWLFLVGPHSISPLQHCVFLHRPDFSFDMVWSRQADENDSLATSWASGWSSGTWAWAPFGMKPQDHSVLLAVSSCNSNTEGQATGAQLWGSIVGHKCENHTIAKDCSELCVLIWAASHCIHCCAALILIQVVSPGCLNHRSKKGKAQSAFTELWHLAMGLAQLDFLWSTEAKQNQTKPTTPQRSLLFTRGFSLAAGRFSNHFQDSSSHFHQNLIEKSPAQFLHLEGRKPCGPASDWGR